MKEKETKQMKIRTQWGIKKKEMESLLAFSGFHFLLLGRYLTIL